ncbi:probable cytochrome P450 6a13 [Melanaphis sacchari]|uniref:probable cytochrome P450 6a13 n=1 Tax=Melanaphis sacchari TaxID=742174 RepID=UPI000DC138AC|nr:probable cytochrome P450 6a13 [Melanaphis sacchari]
MYVGYVVCNTDQVMYLSSVTDWWMYEHIATLFLVIAVTIAYYFSISTFKIWEKLNVPYSKPIPLFGNTLKQALSRDHVLEFYNKIYYEFTGRRYAGLFQMRTPYLMIRDPELINDVLIRDFSFFADRGVFSDFTVNPLSNNLLFMRNPQWKIMRHKITPAFTPGKFKIMCDRIKECADILIKNIDEELREKNNEIEIRNIVRKYSIDVLGTCIFGFDLNVISDDECKFRKYGKLIFTPSLKTLFGQVCLMITPTLLKILKLKDHPKKVTDFFYKSLKDSMMYREENKIIKNDFTQVLMKARNDLVLNTSLPDQDRFTESQIIANAFGMFVAGFDTVSATVGYCLYQLALNNSIQDKVRKEIQLKLSKHNGQINYEFLMDLNYLDMVAAETLRMYPSVVVLFRRATKTYKIPNDSLIIEKGQQIVIPIYALHYDVQYYTDPEKFIPERFSTEEEAKRPNGVYLPFGDGPRMCIGKRFAEIELKLALVEILTKFEVFPCEKTEIPLTFANNIFTMIPKNGIWLKFKKNN